MEAWQIEYLTTIRRDLEEQTTCNEILLQQLVSDGALADVDLESIRCMSVSSEKAQMLYDILETRKDGYVAMVKALKISNQTGAHRSLLQGYAYCFSRKTPINFLGKTKKMSEYFDDKEIKEIIGEARLKLSKEEDNQMHAFTNIQTDGITLVSAAEPPQPSLYISRKLFKRVTIEKRLFQTKCSDIFLFKGLETLRKLDSLVCPQEAFSSSSFLSNVTQKARFLWLEEDEHWEHILKVTTAPTHLITYEEETNTFLLIKTTGGSKILGQHLDKPQISAEAENAHKLLSEDDFIDGIQDGSIVCICDLPGKGKTLLLTKLAHKIAKRFHDRLVVFISLPHFIQSLTNDGLQQDVNLINTRSAILKYLTTSSLAACILDRILGKFKVPMELLFDGFDEVNYRYIDFTKKLLKEVVTIFFNTRVIVTSRPHMRYELEATLGVTAFDIVQFTEANQSEFLVNFWGGKGNTELNSKKLEEFADYCLKNLRGRLTRKEQVITGLPLFCRLIGQVYSRKAKRFARLATGTLTDAEDACQFETSLPNIYGKYIAKSFEKLRNKSESILQVKLYHIWMSLKNLFSDYALEYYSEFCVRTSQQVVDSSISMGILEPRVGVGNGETMQFVHRTFAEYFVSEFIAETLKNLQENQTCSQKFKNQFIRFLLQVVLMAGDVRDTEDVEGMIFTNTVVVYFLNHLMEDAHCLLNADIFAHFTPHFSPGQLYSLLLGCLRENLEKILILVKRILSFVDDHALKTLTSEIIPDGDTTLVIRLVNTASVYSSIQLTEALFALFNECLSFDLQSVCKSIPLHEDTPLHFAIERADVEKIQYFGNIVSLQGRKLLLSCVIRSNEDSPQVVKRKIDMCKLLLSMDKNLLSETSYTLYDSVHLGIIKVLITQGASPGESKSGQNIVHRASKYMSAGDYHELCRFLIKEIKSHQLFKPNETKWKCPLPGILRREQRIDVATMKMILDIPGINVNERYKDDKTLLLIAVSERYGDEMLQMLVKAGADINAADVHQQNALHLAAITANTRAIPFLLNLGVDYKQGDSQGNIFLHYMAAEGSKSEEYHDMLSLLSSKGLTELFHVKNKKNQIPIHTAAMDLDIMDESLQVFKSANVNFNSVALKGWTLLMYAAAFRRSVRFLQSLIEMGSHVLTQKEDGQTFTHLIAKYYYAEEYHQLIDILISKGYEAAFAITDNIGRTPLHSAVIFCELLPETLQLFRTKLVQTNKVSVNCTDDEGGTLLMYAAEGGRSVPLIKALLNMGADPMIKSANGETFAHQIPRGYSAQEFHEIMELLIEKGYGSAFQVADKNGMSALHLAVRELELQQKTLDLIKVKLMETGLVDINSTDDQGTTMLMWAAIGNAPLWNVSGSTPLTTVKWDKQKENFVTYRSMEGGGKGPVPNARWDIQHLKILIEMGADVFIQQRDGSTFAHHIPLYYSPEQYHDIVDFLIGTGNGKVFQLVNRIEQTPLHVAILKLELLEATLDLMKLSLFSTDIVDINSRDTHGNSLLAYAAMGKRSVAFVEKLLEIGVDPILQNKHGLTFAHLIPEFYTAHEYHNLVELFIKRGQERVFKPVSQLEQTPLHIAIHELELLDETLDLLKCSLIKTNIVDMNVTDKNGNSCLVYAAEGRRSAHFLEKFINMGVDPTIQNKDGSTFAHRVPYFYNLEGCHQIIELLIRTGHEMILQVPNQTGQSPLHLAVFNLELAKKTLDLLASKLFQAHNIDVSLRDTEGNSLLLYAAKGRKSVDFLRNLLKMGVDPMIQNKVGQIFTHYIPFYYGPHEYHDILKLLIMSGYKETLVVEDSYGQSPLHVAVYRLELLSETVDLFVALFMFPSSGIQDNDEATNGLNTVDKDGHSVLHWALRGRRSLQFVKYLVDAGANWSVKGYHNNSLAHTCASYGLIDHLKYFVELGCDVNAVDNDGDNVLQCAVADANKNIYEMVTFLLQSGADKVCKNKKPLTVHARAIERGITDEMILDALK